MAQNRIRLLGLTGSIASGKSAVAGRLRELGAFVTDADEVSRELTGRGLPLTMEIGRAFPGTVKDGVLDRKSLACRVFGNPEELEKLNAMTHARIIGHMHELAEEYIAINPRGVAVLDMALLIETGEWKNVDAVWLVTAPDDVRLNRITQRDGCTQQQAKARMDSQMSQFEKLSYADALIDNSSTLEQLYLKVDALYAQLIEGRGDGETL